MSAWLRSWWFGVGGWFFLLVGAARLRCGVRVGVAAWLVTVFLQVWLDVEDAGVLGRGSAGCVLAVFCLGWLDGFCRVLVGAVRGWLAGGVDGWFWRGLEFVELLRWRAGGSGGAGEVLIGLTRPFPWRFGSG